MADLTEDWSNEQWATHLSRQHDGEMATLEELNRFYENDPSDLCYIHPELLKELDGQLQQVVIAWPQLVTDAIEERLDVLAFRYPDAEETDDELWRIWQANGMDEKSQMAHLDALVMRRAFLVVGTNERDDQTPLVTAESPLQMFADFDPATREVRAALKRWNDVDPYTGSVLHRHATLYRPNVTIQLDSVGPGTWRETDRDEHGLGTPPVAVLPNRGRTLVPGGVTELRPVLPLARAANKFATDMMVSGEFHAVPRRVAFGFAEDDFVDETGKPASKWSRLAGRIWATAKRRGAGEDGGADVLQFPEADLRNFHETLQELARITSALSALPPSYFGLAADDAASADAIRSREARLVKRCERKQGPFSGGYERMNRIVMRFKTGEWDPRLQSLETWWRDPATPTKAQAADATVKLVQAGVIPVEQAREDLRYTKGQRARMRKWDEDAMNRAAGGDLAALYGPKVPPEDDPEQVDDGQETGRELARE